LLNLAQNARELRSWSLCLPFLLILVAMLMVSTVRYPSFKELNWETKTRFSTFVMVFVVAVLVWRLQEIAFFFIFLGYITYGLIMHIRRAVRHARMRALRRKVVKMREESPE
jgi:CDP-diacylglycerol---serine O-phosphatidyltransferase